MMIKSRPSWADRVRLPSLLALALALLVAMPAEQAKAQWRPTKPVQVVVMAGKGGGADKAVRFLVDLIKTMNLANVPFEVVNMPDRSGGEAMAYVQGKGKDDHVLLFTLNSFYTTPLDQPELKLDVSSFAPIGRLGEDVFLLWVHADRKDINTIDDFVKVVRAKGGAWVMAGTGTGSEDQLLTEFFNTTYGLKMSYRAMGGGGEVARELAEKRADSTVNNPSEQDEFYPKGLTKPIVAITPKRLPAYPRVPTLRETGTDFHYFMQRSVVGPPSMSAKAQAFYTDLFAKLFNSPQWNDYRAKNSLEGDLISGSRLLQYWAKEKERHVRWKMAISVIGGGVQGGKTR